MIGECKGIIGTLLGHRFSPRYSEGESTLTSVSGLSFSGAIDLINATKPRIYDHDICERCGEIVAKSRGRA